MTRQSADMIKADIETKLLDLEDNNYRNSITIAKDLVNLADQLRDDQDRRMLLRWILDYPWGV